MGFARAAAVPVVIVGDIDRGGVIAPDRRDKDRHRPRGCGPGRRLPRQQVPRRPLAVRGRHGDDRRAHRLAGARPDPVLRGRVAASGRGFHGAGRLAAGHRRARHRRPDPPRRLQFRRPRSAPARAGRAPRAGAARHAAAGRRQPRHPAGIEDDDRRPRRPARRGLGHRSRRPSQARRPRARPLRRLPDAGPQPRRPAGDRGAARAGRRPRPSRRRDGAFRRQAASRR